MELEDEDELDELPLLELLELLFELLLELLELLGVELLLLELLELGVEELLLLLLLGVELLLDDELPSGPFGLSLSQPIKGATPSTTPPLTSRRRNSRRSSLPSPSCFIRWSLHCGYPGRMRPSRSTHQDAATGARVTCARERSVTTPPAMYVSIRRATSSAVIMSMQRGRSPTGSTHSSPGPSL